MDDGSRLISRAEAARILEISHTTLRRYEAQGKLRPGVDANGVHWFVEASVKRLARKRRGSALAFSASLTGRDAAALAAALGLRWPCSVRALVRAAEELAAARAMGGRAPVLHAASP